MAERRDDLIYSSHTLASMHANLLLFLTLLTDAPARPVDFATEIVPVLTKAGCNAGACHGAAAGRGGFHLSLLGADAASDYDAIVQAFEGRRINLARPESSLLLLKPTGQMNHGGNAPLTEGGPGATRLLEWIQSGAPRGLSRRLTKFDVAPIRQVCDAAPAEFALQATAHFDSGPAEDVTRWTVFTSSDPAAVEIDSERSVTRVLRRGQHVVIARFLDRVVPIQFVVPLADAPVDLSHEPRANFIDDGVLQTLELLRVPVSPRADDAAFLRRVCLDLTGRLPEPAEIREFLADSSSDKRARLVDRLLSSDAFADYWTLRLARLLQFHSLPNEKEGVRAYAGWLRKEIAAGTPFNEIGRQLLTATGDSHVVGPANFGRMVGDARAQAELVGQFFMGMRLGCANCHNHPLDRWTQDDYHGLAAVFAKLERGRNVQLAARGAVTNLRTGEPAVPRVPGERYLTADGDPRLDVARWLTDSDNRYFARATVNRLWRAMFGRGLVEPTDDLRETNPATHPDLLDRLAGDFAEQGYDIRRTLRLIANSTTYSRSDAVLAGNRHDDRFYSRAYGRSLLPEVLADAIADVTGVADSYSGHPLGTRAVTLVDPLSPAPSLDILGRCSRAAGCDENAAEGGGLPTQLHLLNGELVNRKLTDPQGRLHRLAAAGKTDAEIITEFHLRALGQEPAAADLSRWCEKIAVGDAEDRRIERLEDFVWSLLNSRKFMENH
jgi:hypothetical protein